MRAKEAPAVQIDRMNARATGRQHCQCGRRSISGMVKGQGLCAYHFDVKVWGLGWANECAARIESQP